MLDKKRFVVIFAFIILIMGVALAARMEITIPDKPGGEVVEPAEGAETILEAVAKIDKRFVDGVFEEEIEGKLCLVHGSIGPAKMQGEAGAVMPALAFEETGEEETFCFTNFVIGNAVFEEEWGVSVSWVFKGEAGGFDLFWCANDGNISDDEKISFKDKSRIARDKKYEKIEIDGVACMFLTVNPHEAPDIRDSDLKIGENVKFMAVAYSKDDKWLAETGWFAKGDGIYPDEK